MEVATNATSAVSAATSPATVDTDVGLDATALTGTAVAIVAATAAEIDDQARLEGRVLALEPGGGLGLALLQRGLDRDRVDAFAASFRDHAVHREAVRGHVEADRRAARADLAQQVVHQCLEFRDQ